MSIILLILILVVIFGGGGYYGYRSGANYNAGLGIGLPGLLLVILLLYLFHVA